MIESFYQAQIGLGLYKISFRLFEHVRTNIYDGSFDFFEDLVAVQKCIDRLKIGLSNGELVEQLLLAE